jgi:hypothetical protein
MTAIAEAVPGSEPGECVEDEQGSEYRSEAQAHNPRCSPLIHAPDITEFSRRRM